MRTIHHDPHPRDFVDALVASAVLRSLLSGVLLLPGAEKALAAHPARVCF